MPIELRHLQYFLAVAEELNFSRAARRLGMAQPPLSRQIRALEGELRVALFSRAARQVQLTDAGRAFQDEARSAIERVEQASEVARRAGRGEVGRLAVGFSAAAEVGMMSTLAPRFARLHPDVRLELYTLRVADQVAALRSGTVQASLFLFPVPTHHDMAVESLHKGPMAVALSRKSPLARRRSLTIAAINREPLVMLSRPAAPNLHDAVAAAFRQARVPLVIAHEVAHLHMAFALLEGGLGVTLLPRGSAGVPHNGIVYRPLDGGPTLEFGIMYRRDDPSELLSRFLDLARQLASVPPRAGH